MDENELAKRKAEILKASESAKAKADALADPQLEAINKQVDALAGIFKELKLTDQATYDSLVEIVEDAITRNQAIGSVVQRIRALGQAGAKLATSIGNVTSGGALSTLRSALKR